MTRKNVKSEALAEELMQGVSPALLQALHILTRDGDLNADSRRKLKQVKHLLQLIEPALNDLLERFDAPLVVDCGAGKGYLGFLLAQTQLQPKGRGSVLNIESRADLVSRAEAIADEAGLKAFVRFVAAPVAQTELGGAHPHLVVALHACDTATDDALKMALATEAEWVAVVPCCQAEVAQLLKQAGRTGALSELYSHPLHRREFGAHLTNVIRVLALEAAGYQVTVTEMVGWEHSLKNELILARKVQRTNPMAKAKLDALLESAAIRPAIVR